MFADCSCERAGAVLRTAPAGTGFAKVKTEPRRGLSDGRAYHHGRLRGHRGARGRRAGADAAGAARLHHRRPARQGGGRKPRAGARRAARHRARAAAKRITVNLAPADLPKEGSHYDLPIALGLMAAMGAIAARRHRRLLRAGRTGARRPDRAGRRRAARRDRRQRARQGADLPGRLRAGGGLGRRDMAILAPQT